MNLHEKILKKKLNNGKIHAELKGIRERINELIENRKKKIDKCNFLKKNEVNALDKDTSFFEKQSINIKQSFTGRLKSSSNDKEYEKIKREKLEKEYYVLMDEINQLKEEVYH